MKHKITEQGFKPIKVELEIERFDELLEFVARLEIGNMTIREQISESGTFDEIKMPAEYGSFDRLYTDLVGNYLKTINV